MEAEGRSDRGFKIVNLFPRVPRVTFKERGSFQRRCKGHVFFFAQRAVGSWKVLPGIVVVVETLENFKRC